MEPEEAVAYIVDNRIGHSGKDIRAVLRRSGLTRRQIDQAFRKAAVSLNKSQSILAEGLTVAASAQFWMRLVGLAVVVILGLSFAYNRWMGRPLNLTEALEGFLKGVPQHEAIRSGKGP